MQNKLHVISHDDIIRICNNFYEEEYIWQEKKKFFDAINKKAIRGRSADKKSKDLNDLLTEMRKLDDANEWQPTCVAMDLSNFPQSEDGTVPNSQILASLHSMRGDLVSKDTLNYALSILKDEILLKMKLLASMIHKPAFPMSPHFSP